MSTGGEGNRPPGEGQNKPHGAYRQIRPSARRKVEIPPREETVGEYLKRLYAEKRRKERLAAQASNRLRQNQLSPLDMDTEAAGPANTQSTRNGNPGENEAPYRPRYRGIMKRRRAAQSDYRMRQNQLPPLDMDTEAARHANPQSTRNGNPGENETSSRPRYRGVMKQRRAAQTDYRMRQNQSPPLDMDTEAAGPANPQSTRNGNPGENKAPYPPRYRGVMKLHGQRNKHGNKKPSEETDEQPNVEIKEEPPEETDEKPSEEIDEEPFEETDEEPNYDIQEEPNEETDGAYCFMGVEDHDFDHSDDFRQWFLVRWLYESGREQYTWEPMEILVKENYLRHLVRYFETLVKEFRYFDPETTKIERRRNFVRGDDDDIWEDDDILDAEDILDDDEIADEETAEGSAVPEDEEIFLIKRVLGYKLPPNKNKRLKYYVEWMDGSITLQPSNFMDGALGDAANHYIFLSCSTRFPNQEYYMKRFAGVYFFREHYNYQKASEFHNGKFKYRQCFNTHVNADGTVKHSLKPFPQCPKCGRGKPILKRGRPRKTVQEPIRKRGRPRKTAQEPIRKSERHRKTVQEPIRKRGRAKKTAQDPAPLRESEVAKCVAKC